MACPHQRERGLILVPILFLVVLVAGLSFSLLEHGLSVRTAVQQHETSFRSLEIAEAGLVAAEIEIRTQIDPDMDGIGAVSGTYAGGSYTVDVAWDPTQPDDYALVARGTYGLSARQVEVKLRRIPHTPFVYSLFAKDDLAVAGSITTDAFDSRLGSWAAQAVNVDAAGPYATGGGHLGSNANITSGGSAVTVRGDARPGPLGTFTSGGSPTIWGSTAPSPSIFDVPDPPIEDFVAALMSNDNADMLSSTAYDPLTLSVTPGGAGTSIYLQGGTYFLTDAAFEGGTQLVVKGPSTVYVTGNFHCAGGTIINDTGKAENLRVYAHPYPVPAGFAWSPIMVKDKGKMIKKPQVILTGGSASALNLYAPGADLLLTGNAELFGAAVAAHITVEGDPQFHYDRALAYAEWEGVRRARRVYWLERSVPHR